MKKISLIIAAALSFAACNDSVKTENHEETHKTETGGTTALAKKTDPVCGMEKDNTWTEFTVTNSDTTWFCSPHCKETFDKEPAKFLNKKPEEKKG